MNQCEITAAIVDDELACIQSLSNDLARFPLVRLLDSYTTPEKAMNGIINQQPDLLFLDVELPGMSGIELLNRIKSDIHQDMYVVFYTAYDKYLLDALRASAFDYLLKPYQPEELASIINRLRNHILDNKKVNIEEALFKLLVNDSRFAIQTISGLTLVRREEILLFRFLKDQRCWQMELTDRKYHKLRMSTTAKELLGISATLVQISQDCIVNISFLTSIENKTLKCVFYHPFADVELVVSSRYYRKLRERLEII